MKEVVFSLWQHERQSTGRLTHWPSAASVSTGAPVDGRTVFKVLVYVTFMWKIQIQVNTPKVDLLSNQFCLKKKSLGLVAAKTVHFLSVTLLC